MVAALLLGVAGLGNHAAASDTQRPSAAEIELLYGIPVYNQVKLQAAVDCAGLVADVRPTNPEAVRWLYQGGLPKPSFLKSKSIRAVDVKLGAKEGMEGTVGFFAPVLPDRSDEPDAEWSMIVDRHSMRTWEQQELGAKMAQLQAEGRIVIEQGVVYGFADDGTRQPYTGDHDLFNLRTLDGDTLGEKAYSYAIDTMIAADMGVVHGAHMYWQPLDPVEQKVYDDIVAAHQPGGEPLIRFAPHTGPILVDAATPVDVRIPSLVG